MSDASGPIPVPESSLEVAHPRPQDENAKYVVTEPSKEKELHSNSRSEEENPKYLVAAPGQQKDLDLHPLSSLEPDHDGENQFAGQRTRSKREWWRNKWVWIALIGVIVVAAALGGGLGATLGKHDSSSTSNSSSGSSTGTSSAPIMSGTATPLAKYVYPTPVLSSSNNIEILAQGLDLNVYRMYSSSSGAISGASTTHSLQQISSATPPWQHGIAAYTTENTNITRIFSTFANGNHYSLYSKYHDANMSLLPVGGWDTIDSTLNTSASIVHWPSSDGQSAETYLFALDQNQHLSVLPYKGSSTTATTQADWVDLGGVWALYTPTTISTARGIMHAMVVDPVTNSVFSKYYNGSSWLPSKQGFNNLNGYVTSKPTLVSSQAGSLDLFARGGDAGLWWKQYANGAFSRDWVSISGSQKITGEVEAIAWGGSGTEKWIDVFVWAESPNDGKLLHKWYENGEWKPSQTGFDTIWNGTLGSPPKALEVSGKLHVFAYNSEYKLVHLWQEGNSGERWTTTTPFGKEQLSQVPT